MTRAKEDHPARRDFLVEASALTAAAIVGHSIIADAARAPSSAGPPTQTLPNPLQRPVLTPLPLTRVSMDAIPRKPLGTTGELVSCLGLGGSTLGDADSLEVAKAIVAEAIDAGVTFFDNAWEYHDGKSEEWMGQALAGRRDKVFLMSKVCTHGRDKNVALQQLSESLARLRTDHLDLWQIHECVYFNDPELHFAPGGVVEAVVQARREGRVRFIGFTGHKHPTIHLRMMEMAEERGVHFDTVQMPLNPFDATFRSFEQHVLPAAQARGYGPIGMKSLGGKGQPVLQGAITVEAALRYAMSLPVSTTVSGMDSLEVLRQNVAIAKGFVPMARAEMDALRARCAAVAADGHLELYKTTKKFDAAVGRKQHGYPSPEELPL